ncbi:MAG: S9 family peptidase [Verrucomicrobia bacterium]|nr:S9 family peptidase [Verrucomicrobiota bacterium]
MRLLRALCIAALMGRLCVARGEALPDAAWFQPPGWSWLRLSPEGRQVAGAAPGDSGHVLWILDSHQPARRRQASLPEGQQVADAAWLGEDLLAVLATRPGGGGFFLLDPREGTCRPFAAADGATWIRLSHPQPRSGGIVLVEGWASDRRGTKASGPWLDLLAVEIATGRSRVVARNPGDVVQWLADRTGAARVAMAVTGDRRELRVRPTSGSGEHWTRVAAFDAFGDPATLAALAPDGSRAWVNCRQDRDTLGLVALDVAAGRLGPRVASDDRFDITGAPLLIAGVPAAVSWERLRPHTQWSDPGWEQAARELAASNPETHWRPLELSDDGLTGVFENVSDRQPVRHAVVLRESPGHPRWLESPQRLPVPLGVPRAPITLLARDGSLLSGYVTRTPDAAAGPLVVLAHGGPWTRDHWGWSAESQFLASRGWTVLQINYRGSAGFGHRFQQAGAGRWADVAVSDLASGVTAMVDQQLADPARVAVAGGSFGGYLTLAALLAPDSPYRGGASVGGVFDLRRWFQEARRKEPRFASRWQREWLSGSPTGRLPDLPPVRNLLTPLLLLHAADDSVVPWSQSRRLCEAAARHGAPVEMVTRHQGGHTLGSPESQAAVWNQVESFLRQHRPAPVSRPAAPW